MTPIVCERKSYTETREEKSEKEREVSPSLSKSELIDSNFFFAYGETPSLAFRKNRRDAICLQPLNPARGVRRGNKPAIPPPFWISTPSSQSSFPIFLGLFPP
jgi:hypothetical protein